MVKIPNRNYELAPKAVEMADVPLLELLLKYGLGVAQIRIQCRIRAHEKTNSTISYQDNYTSPLLMACGYGMYLPRFSMGGVELLLDHRSDVNQLTSNERTLLMMVCSRQGGDWKERLQIAEMLLDRGADPDLKDKDGNGCLYYARQNESKQFEKLILSRMGKQ
jgi:ankyrin repeat protein